MLKLIQAADYDVEKAERIIYIDEIDKIARNRKIRPLHGRIREGTTGIVKNPGRNRASVPPQGGQHPHQEFIQIDTRMSCLLRGLLTALKRSLNAAWDKVIGFGSNNQQKDIDDKHILSHVQPEDLLHFGLIPGSSAVFPL